MENKETNYSIFNDQVKFDDPNELKKYVSDADGPEITKLLVNALETANKGGSFTLGESVIVSEILERAVSLLSLITKKTEDA